MSGFSADWLHLREPFDHQARKTALSALALPAQIERWREGSGVPLSVVDLACGSGSNLRALAPLLGGAQRWRLVDHDPALLTAVPGALANWAQVHGYRYTLQDEAQGAGKPGFARIKVIGPRFGADITLQQLDLARDLACLDFADTQLVTGSALLDLVSAAWLEALIRQALNARAAMLFALNVDGQTDWTPPDPHDQAIHALFASHQLRDKGFGPALSGQAIALALRLMRDAGYVVTQARSDWIIDAQDAHVASNGDAPAMLAAMIDGMATAAVEQAQSQEQPTSGSDRQTVLLWQARRRSARQGTRLQVGHVDLCATLP